MKNLTRALLILSGAVVLTACVEDGTYVSSTTYYEPADYHHHHHGYYNPPPVPAGPSINVMVRDKHHHHDRYERRAVRAPAHQGFATSGSQAQPGPPNNGFATSGSTGYQAQPERPAGNGFATSGGSEGGVGYQVPAQPEARPADGGAAGFHTSN